MEIFVIILLDTVEKADQQRLVMNATIQGQGGEVTLISFDITSIMSSIVATIKHDNDTNMKEVGRLIEEQNKKISEVAASTRPTNSVMDVESEVETNTPDGVPQHNSGSEALSVDGSNRWFQSIAKSTSSHQPSEKTGNQESVLEESQEFWHKAATQDYEDVTNAIGEEVSSSIAGATKVLWQKLLLEDILKEKMSNAVTPAKNCSYLIPKRINTEVWSTIPSYARTADSNRQEIQRVHAAAVTMLLRAASDLTEASKTKEISTGIGKDIMDKLKEAVSLSGKNSQMLNQFRRDQIKPSLPKDYKKLAVNNDESSNLLFGESVRDRLEALNKENKLTRLLEKDKVPKKKPNQYSNNSQQGKSSNWRSSYKTQKRSNDDEGRRPKYQQDKKTDSNTRMRSPHHKKKKSK